MTTPGQQQRLGIVPYDTRRNPLVPPGSGIFDEPTRPICINVEWIPHIDGMLERLIWADAWQGEQSEIEFAIAQIRKLMISLALGNNCMTNIELRQNPTNPCILESSYDGGQTWTQFADLSGCSGLPGADGTDGREVEFNVSATHIQWRYVGDSTWIDLVPLAELTGADGSDGQPGSNGTDGREVEFNVSATHIQWRYVGDSTWIDLIALDNLKGEPGETGTNNELPPTPTLAETDKLCSAATGITDRILALVTEIVNDLATLTNLEVLEALLLSPGGWNGSVLQQLIGLLETTDSATIISEFNAEKTALIEQLYCSELDKDTAVTWAQAVVSWSSVTQSVIGQAIEAVSDGQWALWAFIDGEKGLGDCSSFVCGSWEQTFDFTTSQQGWVQSQVSGLSRASYVSGEGWKVHQAGNSIVIMRQLPSTATIIETELQIGATESGTINLQIYNSPSTFVSTITSRAISSQSILNIGHTYTIDGNKYIGINYTAGDGTMSQTTRIASVILRGNGVNPFI